MPLGAPGDAVERAFRHAARLRHPDLGGDPGAFRRAAEARAVLLRPAPPDPVAWVLGVVVRYHPGVRLLEAVVRVIDRRTPPRP